MTMPSSQTGHAGSHVSPSRLRKATLWDKLLANGSVVSIALFFLVVCVVFSVITDAFLTAPNLLNIIRQSAAAVDRCRSYDLRHHHRRYRSFRRLGAGAGRNLVGDGITGGDRMATGHSVDGVARCRHRRHPRLLHRL